MNDLIFMLKHFHSRIHGNAYFLHLAAYGDKSYINFH